MATTFGPPVPIDGPPPVKRPYGLLSVSRELDESEKAGMGVIAEPYPAETPFGFDPCSAGTFRQKEEGTSLDNPLFAGWTAYTPVTCTRAGVGNDATFAQRAARVLEATDQHAMERQLVAGDFMPLNPHVGDSDVAIIASAAVTAEEALGLLEDMIATTGRGGVLLLTPGTVAVLGDKITPVGGRLVTANGTPVIAGSGLVGTKPDEAADLAAGTDGGPSTEQYGWAIGPVFHYRSDVYIPGDRAANLDRQQNVQTYRAERELVVGWDKVLQAAVLIDSAA